MKKHARKKRRGSHLRNPSRTVADPHGARELALCYDNERAQQGQKESIINNLARKMAKGQYETSKAVKLWGYAAKSGADAYAKTFGSHGDTGSSMFNAATRAMAAKILEEENRDYVKERAQEFGAKKTKRNPSRKRRSHRAARRNPAPSREARFARLERLRAKHKEHVRRTYTSEDMETKGYAAEMKAQRLYDMASRAARGDRSYRKLSAKERPAPSLYHIEMITRETAPYYFSPKAMKAFGQRKSDFKVIKSKKSGRVFITAKSRTHKGMYSLKEFVGNRLKSVSGAPAHFEDVRDWVNRQ